MRTLRDAIQEALEEAVQGWNGGFEHAGEQDNVRSTPASATEPRPPVFVPWADIERPGDTDSTLDRVRRHLPRVTFTPPRSRPGWMRRGLAVVRLTLFLALTTALLGFGTAWAGVLLGRLLISVMKGGG